jgi:hypothetical protein
VAGDIKLTTVFHDDFYRKHHSNGLSGDIVLWDPLGYGKAIDSHVEDECFSSEFLPQKPS